jgi:hypothetical protein
MHTYLPQDPTHVATLQRYARAAGVAMLLSIVFGFLGESYLPSRIIVRSDAAATAANILGNPTLFRLTFASYLVEGICDVALGVIFYVILRPVDRNLALLSAFFGIVATVTFAIAESGFFASSVILREAGGMSAFTTAQREALALLSVRIGSMIAALFLCMYGIATMVRGYLIARSGYLPRILGILFFVGGAGFFLRSTLYIVAPSLSSPLMLLPMAIAAIPLMGWLLFRGIRVAAG